MATLVTLDELSLHFGSAVNKNDTETSEVAKHRHKLQPETTGTARAGCREKETVEDKKSRLAAPSRSNGWIFKPKMTEPSRNSTCKHRYSLLATSLPTQ